MLIDLHESLDFPVARTLVLFNCHLHSLQEPLRLGLGHQYRLAHRTKFVNFIQAYLGLEPPLISPFTFQSPISSNLDQAYLLNSVLPLLQSVLEPCLGKFRTRWPILS